MTQVDRPMFWRASPPHGQSRTADCDPIVGGQSAKPHRASGCKPTRAASVGRAGCGRWRAATARAIGEELELPGLNMASAGIEVPGHMSGKMMTGVNMLHDA
jgi:hypothetical protein